jgi:hypothetical protein
LKVLVEVAEELDHRVRPVRRVHLEQQVILVLREILV